jgi:putative redox protein
MKAQLTWKQKMLFAIDAGGNGVEADARAPIGNGQAMAPKELLLAALGSCTAMDVVALLKKHKQGLRSFNVDVEAELSEGRHPKVFTSARLTFSLEGDVEPDVALRAVSASQTTFCGVSAMLSRAFPIAYEVFVNGTLAGSGNAQFD